VISIVDDDRSVREGIVDLVAAIGFDAEAFACAEDFLASSRIDSTSFLIVDVCMPGMNGLALHDSLVASGKRIPTILITAFPSDPERRRATRAGVVGYLVKPFDESQLVACIMASIGSPPAETR
jgi:FixJ family two-component response regulator